MPTIRYVMSVSEPYSLNIYVNGFFLIFSGRDMKQNGGKIVVLHVKQHT